MPRPAQLVQFDGERAVLFNRSLHPRRYTYHGAHELAHLWLDVNAAGFDRTAIVYNLEDVPLHDDREGRCGVRGDVHAPQRENRRMKRTLPLMMRHAIALSFAAIACSGPNGSTGSNPPPVVPPVVPPPVTTPAGVIAARELVAALDGDSVVAFFVDPIAAPVSVFRTGAVADSTTDAATRGLFPVLRGAFVVDSLGRLAPSTYSASMRAAVPTLDVTRPFTIVIVAVLWNQSPHSSLSSAALLVQGTTTVFKFGTHNASVDIGVKHDLIVRGFSDEGQNNLVNVHGDPITTDSLTARVYLVGNRAALPLNGRVLPDAFESTASGTAHPVAGAIELSLGPTDVALGATAIGVGTAYELVAVLRENPVTPAHLAALNAYLSAWHPRAIH